MFILNKGLDVFLHSLIPPALQLRVNPNTMEYIRIRSLSAMLAMITAVSLITNLLVGGGHLLLQPEMLKYDLVSFVILLLLALQTWLFYRFHNDWISGIAFTNFYFLIAVVLLLFSGGYGSYFKPFLLSCPVISFLVGGRAEGIQHTITVIVVCWILVVLHVLGFNLPNMFETQPPLLLFGVNWVTTVIIITMVLTMYENELSRKIKSSKLFVAKNATETVTMRMQVMMDRMTPAGFRSKLDPSSLSYTRVQIIMCMLLLGTLASSLMTTFFVVWHLLFSPQYLSNDMVAGFITLCFVAQLILFYRKPNYYRSVAMINIFYSQMIFILVIISGGFQSPFLILLISCPIVSFMTHGFKGGVLNSTWTAVIGFMLAYLSFSGHVLINYIESMNNILLFAVIWPVLMAGIAFCMILYDMELEKP